MKRTLYIALLLFSFNQIISQNIEDRGIHRILEDVIEVNDNIYQFRINGTCRSGNITRGTDGNLPFLNGFNYVGKGQFESFEDMWVSLALVREADDIGPDFNVVSTGDISSTQNFVWDQWVDFRDFTIIKSNTTGLNLILLDQKTDRLFVYSFTGELRKEIFHFLTPVDIDGRNDMLYVFEDQNIHILNEDDELVKSVFTDDSILSFEWLGDTLLTATSEEIQLYNANLDLLESILVPSANNMVDLCIQKKNIYALNSSDDQTTVFEIDSNRRIANVYENNNPFLHFDRILPYENSVSIFGHQVIEGGENERHSNLVQQDINSSEENKNKISIDLLSIKEIRDTFMIHIDPQGNEIPEIHYSYNYSLEISNPSSDKVINDFFIASNRVNGINCAYAQIIKKFDNTIGPNESIIIDSSYNAIRKFDEFCFHALSVNGQVDPEFFDNSTCKNTTAVDNQYRDLNFNIFPNPTTNQLHFESDTHIKSVQILTAQGQVAQRLKLNNQNSIDVSGLDGGLYFLRVEMDQNEFLLKKFIKG